MIDWTAVGSGAGMLLTGILGWFTGKGRRDVSTAQDNAQISDYRADQATTDAAAVQISLLVNRVSALETKYSALWDELQAEKVAGSRLRDRVRQLEGILRANNITIPPEQLQ
jgi:hypothetical protein